MKLSEKYDMFLYLFMLKVHIVDTIKNNFYLLLNNKLEKLYEIVGDGKYDNEENEGTTFPKALKNTIVSTNYV